jgi:ATP-dependent DNA helicase RecG
VDFCDIIQTKAIFYWRYAMIENQDVEFKSTWKDEWLEWICGMANSNGGIIYIGKDDKGNTIGVEHAVKLVKDLPGKIRDTMGIIPKVTAVDDNKKTYIVIEIDKYPTPIYYKSKLYVRSGSNNFELTGIEQQKFILERAGKKWEDILVPEATYDDLSKEAIDFFREKAKERGRLSEKT